MTFPHRSYPIYTKEEIVFATRHTDTSWYVQTLFCSLNCLRVAYFTFALHLNEKIKYFKREQKLCYPL